MFKWLWKQLFLKRRKWKRGLSSPVKPDVLRKDTYERGLSSLVKPDEKVLVRPYVPHLPAISEVLMGESGDRFKKEFCVRKVVTRSLMSKIYASLKHIIMESIIYPKQTSHGTYFGRFMQAHRKTSYQGILIFLISNISSCEVRLGISRATCVS